MSKPLQLGQMDNYGEFVNVNFEETDTEQTLTGKK